MATWVKVVADVLLALVALAVSSSFWSLVKLPKYLLEVMRKPSYLDLLQISQFTGVIEVDPIRESAIGYATLLYVDFRSSLDTWKKVKYATFVGCLVLMFLSYLLGFGYFIVTLAVCLFAGFMGIQDAAKGNVLRDVQVMLGRIDRWNASDPEGCREYCTEKRPKVFREMYLSVLRRNP